MDMTPADLSQGEDGKCCNFAALMPCETNDLMISLLFNKVIADGTIPAIAITPVPAHPAPENIRPRRSFFSSHILKSQIIYLQTARLRI